MPSLLKIQAAIQGDRIRVSGKNRDDLQEIISSLRDSASNLPLQFINFRDLSCPCTVGAGNPAILFRLAAN